MISADKLALYVELNTSYRLLPEDARLLPNNEAKANKVLNELCVAWALVPVPACLNLAAPRELSVPLLAGPINKPVPLDALYASGQLPKPPGVGGRGLFGGGKQQTQAVLALRVGPLPAMPLPVIPYSFMPPNLVSDVPLSYAFAAFRMALGAELVYQPTAFTPIADAVVASFPRILNDHHMFSAFMTKWTAVLQPFLKLAKQAAAYKDRERMPTLAAVVEAFRQCVIEAAPVLHCQAVLPKHINNFVQHNQARANVVQAYFSNVDPKRGGMPVAPRDPVEPLSHAASQFLHKPFDVSELRVCLADALPQTTWLHA